MRRTTGAVFLIQHGDLECRYSTPPRAAEAATFYAEPWQNPASAYPYGIGHRPTGDDWRCVALETDVTWAEIGRTADRLGELFGALEQVAQPEDLVLLSSTCLPSKLGDDPRIGELLRKSQVRAPVLYNAPDVDQSVPPLVELLRRALHEGHEPRQPKLPHTINLVGFPRSADKAALVRLLADAGITVNVDLLPDVDLDDMGRFHAAPLTVLFPERHLEAIYQRLFDDLDGERIAPPAPYGLAASHQWLSAIAQALGRGTAGDRAWQLHRRRLRPELEPLLRDLDGRAVGFIGSRAELKSLTDPGQTQGVPLFAMLEEMGVGAGWFEFAPEPPPAGSTRPGRSTFGSANELRELLAASECDAVYSDVAWDRRITGAGKVPISLGLFRLGPDGFLQSATELLRACRFRFYRDYREFLT
ncbi:MAG: hypothetical protein JRI23_32700 [Deltaproteobacteria bacterium]|nr:hypothetical protein [Deltaproteobacteria bacterium]MBW2537012.1 hypothetical protein [Deltaproteobacteria bacterium]